MNSAILGIVEPVTPRSTQLGDDAEIVAALRRGDEEVFSTLVSEYSGLLLRLAQDFVKSRSVAEEVVQDTWLALLNGIDRFEMRSSLKTWLFRILVYKAKSRRAREARTVPFSSLVVDSAERAVPEERFSAGEPWPGHWGIPPIAVHSVPEERILAREVRERIAAALEMLPELQRIVVRLRDIAGWEATEVCSELGLTDANQRVLLHRGRARLRATLEQYLGEC